MGKYKIKKLLLTVITLIFIGCNSSSITAPNNTNTLNTIREIDDPYVELTLSSINDNYLVIEYESNVDIHGFAISISDSLELVNITNMSGGESEENEFLQEIYISEDLIFGYSPPWIDTIIPAGSSILTIIEITPIDEIIEICLNTAIIYLNDFPPDYYGVDIMDCIEIQPIHPIHHLD